MKSLFFRELTNELVPIISGSRVDKVYLTDSKAVVFELFTGQGKRFLVSGKYGREGFVFLAPNKPVVPGAAKSLAMWWRKRIKGARVEAVFADWSKKILFVQLKHGLVCLHLGALPSWAPFDSAEKELAASALREEASPAGSGNILELPALEEVLSSDPGPSAMFISRALRRHLTGLDRTSAHQLWEQLSQGAKQGFDRFYLTANGPSLWPARDQDPVFETALEASRAFFEPWLHEMANQEAQKEEKRRQKAAKRRLERLEADEKRMQALTNLQESALAIAANMYFLKKSTNPGTVELQYPDAASLLRVDIDPELGITGTMNRFFALAAKGRRGLLKIAELRRTPPVSKKKKTGEFILNKPQKTSLKSSVKEADIARFAAPDNLSILRGKNARSNHYLLTRLARPHDLWFHAEGGPGAHVILRLAHPGQEPSENCLLEAAKLAAEAGYERQAAKAKVISAFVKHVRPIAGESASGQVAIDKVFRSFIVNLQS